MNNKIINESSKCPVIKPRGKWETFSWGEKWQESGEATDEHFFVEDYMENGFFSNRGLIGIHCSKCGLTIKYE